MGCQEGGGKILIKRMSLNSWVAKKGGGNFDKKKIIESMGCQEGKGGEKIGKNTIIESKGCQEGGWRGGKNFEKTKALKAWVAKKGGGKY